ncbi:hypothetical protein N8Z28_00180 [bacterium]|nr:hypothetical protein [bacterium]
MSIHTICASVCASVKLAFLVKRRWTLICGNIPNYNNTYMYHFQKTVLNEVCDLLKKIGADV